MFLLSESPWGIALLFIVYHVEFVLRIFRTLEFWNKPSYSMMLHFWDVYDLGLKATKPPGQALGLPLRVLRNISRHSIWTMDLQGSRPLYRRKWLHFHPSLEPTQSLSLSVLTASPQRSNQLTWSSTLQSQALPCTGPQVLIYPTVA